MRSLAALLFAALLLLTGACTADGDGPRPEASATAPSTTTTSPAATPTPIIDPNALPARDVVDLARRLRGLHGEAPDHVNATTPEYPVGDHRLFYVIHMPDPGEAGEEPPRVLEVWATLQLVTPHGYFYIQDGESFEQGDLEAAGTAFEDTVYPTVTGVFGKERNPGIDNDLRITLLHAHLEGAAGYYSDMDGYPRAIAPLSNEREMVYMDLPTLPLGGDAYLGVLAHELQHLVDHSNDPNEDLWVNEGLSELAASLVRPGSSMAFAFLADPDLQLNDWDPSGNNFAHYGAADLFARYLSVRSGGPGGLSDLVTEPLNGTAGVTSYLRQRGVDLSFFDVFRDWVVANYVDGVGDGTYDYPDLDVHAAPSATLRGDETGEATVRQFAADYIEVDAPEEGATFAFDGAETVPVLPVGPHGGSAFWWSARGDSIDTTLTRELDLTELSKATLRFWTWFHVDRWYDYGYVVVSTDGGKTWQALRGRHTTTDDPLRQAYGPGYTGRSGGGEESVWVEESIDLTPFAGKRILLRFEYVTDGGINGAGWAIDDLRVPELGYEDDAEGEAGWEPAGFRRVTGPLLQRFVVQVVTLGGEPRVRQVTLDTQNQAQVTIGDTGATLDAVVIVAALTEGTTEAAHYKYALTARP